MAPEMQGNFDEDKRAAPRAVGEAHLFPDPDCCNVCSNGVVTNFVIFYKKGERT